MPRRGHRRRRRAGYQLVHVTPDGVRHPTGAVVGAWPEALARAERVVAALRTEVGHGNTEAGGLVWVIDTANGTIVQTFPVSADAPAGQ